MQAMLLYPSIAFEHREGGGGGLEWINIGGICLGNYVVFCSLPFCDTSLRLSFINHNKYRRLSSPNILGNLCHFVVHYHVPHFQRVKIQTLSVTFTLRTSLKDVRGHSNRTSGDIPTGCPAMFYFCILT